MDFPDDTMFQQWPHGFSSESATSSISEDVHWPHEFSSASTASSFSADVHCNSLNPESSQAEMVKKHKEEGPSLHQNYDELKPIRVRGIDLDTARDRSLNERKRRRKLSQRFVALSTLIPGSKKMDKSSIVGDAVEYLKQLQEKVKGLEEQTNEAPMEPIVVKKYVIGGDGSIFTTATESRLPEVEARTCNKDVLITINCVKRKWVMEKVVAEIEKLHLSVVKSSVMTFGDSALHIKLVAKKNEEFSLSMEELVENLNDVLAFKL